VLAVALAVRDRWGLASICECGVEMYEYNRTMLHHKIMVVDGAWATVGTANFDNRSFAHDEESNVCFSDPDGCRKTAQYLPRGLAGV
jgi:cardiolipin synthase